MIPIVSLLVLGFFPQPLQAQDLRAMFFQPSTLDPVSGEVAVDVDVQAPEPVTVDLFVDGVRIGSRSVAPYQWMVDVGRENVEHHFKAVAVGRSGVTKITAISTPAIPIDASMDVNLQQLYITAMKNGERALDLVEDEFRILDSGSPQHIVTFARGEVPITAILLLDASESMRGSRFEAALSGSVAFARGMRELDEAKLVLFSDQVLEATPFTHDPAALIAALGGVEAAGNTAVNDHLYLGLKLLEARQGRRVAVLFTDGADLHSVLPMRDVLWATRRSQALIYWIRLQETEAAPRFSTAWRDSDANAAEVAALEQAVRESGGRVATISAASEIERAFRGIMEELREQYVIGYYPSLENNDGRWHHVEVRIDRRGVKVRTRGGYIDD